jgi:hypothetical protein
MMRPLNHCLLTILALKEDNWAGSKMLLLSLLELLKEKFRCPVLLLALKHLDTPLYSNGSDIQNMCVTMVVTKCSP